MDSNTEQSSRFFTAEELLRYHGGELTQAEMHEMERAALDDPFLADALEGWESLEGASILDEVSRPDGNTGMSWKAAIRPVLIATGIGVMVFAIFQIQQNIREMNQMQDQLEKTLAKNNAPYIVSPAQDSLDELEIRLSTELEVAKQIVPERIVKEIPIPQPEQVVETEVEAKPRADKLPEELKTLPERKVEPTTPKKERKVEAFATYYVNDLKVADYRPERTDREDYISIWSHTSSNTPASQEELNENKSANGFKVVEVAYGDYLSKAMDRFSKEDYKEALRMYRVILKNFPNDVNAHFYGGLAYFNLNRQKKASGYLSRAQYHPSRVFVEEAEYYRALSLIQAKKRQEARLILRNIQRNEGFYSTQAQSLLESF